jgi:type II secretory pathway pseudopilin PulG
MSLSLRCQRGFTTVTLMGVLMVGGLMVAAGVAAVEPDIKQSRADLNAKQAHAAAEAGLNWYLYHLGQDNNLFVKCTNLPNPSPTEAAPVNQAWNGSGADPRRWRTLPDIDAAKYSTDERAQYTIELLPAQGFQQCVENNQQSMLDPTLGTFRIRATGCLPPPGQTCREAERGDKRSIVASLRRKGFLDFLYFTDFETSDPATYPRTDNTVGEGSGWADRTSTCKTYRQSRHRDCVDIRFADDDVVQGPMHTNDDILTCGTPVFGRTANDAIELNGLSPGYIRDCSSGHPTFKGTRVWPGGNLFMPPNNRELATIADPAYRFRGRTDITLTGNNMSVRTYWPTQTTRTMSLPTNGVIWVESPPTGGGCPAGYTRRQIYNAPSTCGNVEVRGNYSQELTIGATNDIIIEEDLKRNAPGLLLGLVAQNFVRVYHPVDFDGNSNSCDTDGGPSQNLNIEAAILAMDHSFIVDNYYCGGYLGTLTVDGAIAQRYRGPVGTGGDSGISTGYLKNYVYNDRLRFREPPFFIDPVQSSWRVARQNEQVPAR